MDFAGAIDLWCDEAEAKLEAVVRYTLMEVAQQLVARTPYGQPRLWVRRRAPAGYRPGQARAGWHYAAGAPVVALPTAPDASGLKTVNTMIAAFGQKVSGKVHFFTNNVSYIEELERGHSRLQAPNGMVGLTTMDLPNIVERAILTANATSGKVLEAV